MKQRLISAFKEMCYLLLSFGLMLALNRSLTEVEGVPQNYLIHILIFLLTFIVCASVSVLYIMGKEEHIGFAYLGFVVFKMFGIGYLAVFQPEFRKHIILYFMVFWFYLFVEAVISVRLIKKIRYKS